ncbi:MAG TPA: LysM peptidoglycan-binding domain-containing protein [Flavobacterium sp.]|jgi:LysM repeat protein|nr:LysM peptidoglycan-binding domain-containing protein [Flavobacterium sp.]
MKKLMLLMFLVGLCGVVEGQNDSDEYDVISHQVKQGETVRLLSLRYLATPSDIYQMNKGAINGISPGMVIYIPVKRKTAKKSPEQEQHSPDIPPTTEVVHEENNTKSAGPAIAEIPIDTNETATTHKVQPGETLSALARKYGTTVIELKSLNEKALQRGLQSGQILKLPGVTAPQQMADTAEPAQNASPTTSDETPYTGAVIQHTVASKETLYSIAKKYNVSVSEITAQNEKLLAHGLQAGQVIKIKPNK